MDQYRDKIIEWQHAAQKTGSFFVFDTETTGIPGKDPIVDIIEFSAIKVAVNSTGMDIVDSLDLYIDLGYPVPEIITKLTGITQEKVDTDGVSQMEAYDIIHNFWGDRPVLCGYNSISFDEPLVNELYHKTIGSSFWCEAHLDVLRMAKEKIKVNNAKTRKPDEIPNRKLSTLAGYLGVDEDAHFHEAIEDVKATYRVMRKLMPMYKTPEPTNEPDLRGQLDGFYISYISHFKKSYKLNRIYVKNNLDAKIYYDIPNHMWYIGNRLPEDVIIPIVYKKAGVSNINDFVKKYEQK